MSVLDTATTIPRRNPDRNPRRTPGRTPLPASTPLASTTSWPDVVESMYRERFDELCRLARRLVDTPHGAEEVVQEAFSRLVALQHRPSDGKELAYLRSIVMNEARSVLRRRQVGERHRVLDVVVDDCSPAEEVVRRDDARRIWQTIGTLPRRQRQVIALRHAFDLSERETASALSISAGSVKTHASRGLSSIRRTADGSAS